MDKKKGLINITVSIIFKLILTILTILTRHELIKTLGNDINGLNSLYLSIIGVVSIAELGIGSSIIYCMYSPIVKGDFDKVSALYNLYRKLYIIIAVCIGAIGIAILPFLPILAKDYSNLNINLYFPFLLMLISIILTYLFSAKTSLINAYKNDYITTTISSIGMIFQCISQIITLKLTNSFIWYLICRIVAVLIQWILTEIVVRKKHRDIINKNNQCDNATKNDVRKKTSAMFIHKLGGVLVNSADSVIISSFIGISILGKYSNYTLIMNAMINLLSLFFTSLITVIGHMMVNEDRKVALKYFKIIYSFNFFIGIIFFSGYNQIINEIIRICFGNNLELDSFIIYVITINYFIQYMRKSIMVFKDACGAFYYDRYKPLVEGITNVFLSILFVIIFPAPYKVVGVIVATIITNLLICNIIEPYVLFKYGFKTSGKKFIIKNYILNFLFIIILILLKLVRVNIENDLVSLLINGVISVIISLIICAIFILFDKDLKTQLVNICKKFILLIKRKRAK